MSSEVRCWCQHCEKELEPSHTGVCPYCGKTGKACVVTTQAGVGISTKAVISVSRELPEEERRLWERFIKFLKDNIIIDGFEIGFPSGIKIIFKTKKDSKEK